MKTVSVGTIWHYNLESEQKFSDNQLIRKAMGRPRLFTDEFIQE